MPRAFFLISLLLLSCSAQNPAPVSQAQPSPAATQAAAAKPATKDAALTATEFAQLIERVSEPNGYFDTDNLISNETSYLHVVGKLRKMNINGGAYIGVGPDQNFSYMAQIRPRIAFIIDIRRDNQLQHLLFKSLFALARNRVEYLCLLFGKPVPNEATKWNIAQVVEYLDKTPADRKRFEATRTNIAAKLKTFGLKLDGKDFATINRIHEEFFSAGLDLKFTSHHRSPRSYYPNYRDLMLEKDLTGKQTNYLVNEDDFQFLKSLEDRNLVIPAVGNFAGDKAFLEVGKILKERGEKVTAFYTSNVEYYLMGDSSFDRYAENVRQLPIEKNGVLIRSYFGNTYSFQLPQAIPGYYSAQLLQPLESFVKGNFQSYRDLITQDSLDLK
ncbi:MAG: hypothetical protein JST84_00055 [Acidobacteria bacterium]|nr:hypothetical protein [Acidobacteriota bacterium]